MIKIKTIKELCFILAALIIIITLIVLVSIVGKNLTYTTKFTPPSTELSLKNQSYFT